MNNDKKCFYLSIETTPKLETHLQCINDECEYYLGFVDNGECENCKKFYLR
jgi:hypothetical protein